MFHLLKKSATPLRRGLPQLGMLALALSLSALEGPATAREGDQIGQPAVSLTYDATAETLLRSEPQALYRSADEGRSWEAVSLPSSAANGRVAVVDAPAEGGALYIAGPGLGVLRTEDGGESWVALNEGLPGTEVASFAAHSTQPETLYVYLPETGIYRSQDAGKSWRLVDKGPEGIRQLIHSNMEGSMDSGWLYAATPDGGRVSMDCFCFWRGMNGLGGEVHSIAYDPQQPEHLYAIAETGLFRSTDGGQNWEQAASPESATALTVAPSGTLYAASEDGTLLRSTDRAETWERIGG